MSFRLGLTGSIGMGKSTTSDLFHKAGCPVWDADAAVHRLYAPGGAAVAPMAAAFPGVIVEGGVSRDLLRAVIAADPTALSRIEAIVHPLVAADRAAFAVAQTAPIIVFDIPLLFETGGDAAMDSVVVVSAPADVQRARVLARGTMTEAQFDTILAKQMPDAEKRARAEFVIITDTLDHAATQVKDILALIQQRIDHA